MDVMQCLRSRRTVRKFKPDPVPDAVVAKVLQAARWAPSSRNQQPWHLIVIRDRDTLAKVAATAFGGPFVAEAPLAIALIMEDADLPEVDAGRALQQMEIMAWSEGLGTCYVGMTPEEGERIKEWLGIPERMRLVTVLPFGYRPDGFQGRGIPRKPLSDMAYNERFGESWVG